MATTTIERTPIVAAPPVVRHRRRSGRYVLGRAGLYALAILITLFMLLPIYFIAISAFSPQAKIYAFPKEIIPHSFSNKTFSFFIHSTGVLQSVRNSIIVGIGTLALSTLIGAPAGLALARFVFKGRGAFQLFILSTRAFPGVILAIPLLVTFIKWNLYDRLLGVILVHTAFTLPTTILVMSSIFVSIPRDLEEAALTLGCTPFAAFWRIMLPLSLPGIAATAIFTFVASWNEVFAATILTVKNRTLPAQVLASLNSSQLPYKFAGGFALVIPSLVFIFFMRRYLFNMWGRVVR
jgi:multiple sugar transport system permease protein